MYCPRCGQSQISEETRFCSRCGFALGLVSEILAGGGTLPQLAQLSEAGNKKLTRGTGVKIGLAWFLVVTFLLTPLAAIAGLEEGAFAIGVLGFVGGILMMVFSTLFLKPEQDFMRFAATGNQLSGNRGGTALPPVQTAPARDFVPAENWRTPATGELRPPSVTEETTKLLRKEE